VTSPKKDSATYVNFAVFTVVFEGKGIGKVVPVLN
jgi:hypothetical protein